MAVAHDGRIAVDGIRLSDLGPMGWIGLAIVAVSLGHLAWETVTWVIFGGEVVGWLAVGGIGVLFGAFMAYEDGSPECEGTCDNCGTHIRSHASRDGKDEYITVHTSGTPRRASLGPFTFVLSEQRDSHTYCSGECATEDAESRVMIDHVDHGTVASTRADEA